jgi:hypothetical protein
MIEQRPGLEDRMLGFAQEAGLSDSAENERCRQIAAGGIEPVIGKLNRKIWHVPPLQRREQGLKPLRVLVEDGKLRAE